MDPILTKIVSDLCGSYGLIPQWIITVTAMLVSLVIVLVFIALNAMFMIWLERKICGRIQRRPGPMITGLKSMAQKSMWLGGWLQTPCDSFKLIFKEDIIAERADRFGFILAPILVFMAALAVYVPLPWSATTQVEGINYTTLAVADLNIGLLYVVAIPSLTVLSIICAGWSSNNKYSLLGGLRSGMQMLSYEIPMLFALMGPVVLAGSLSLGDLVVAQKDLLFGIPLTGWFVIPSFLGAIIYLICAIAETNRPPFDMPESEQELVSGFNTEYTAMRFAMFYLAEFSNTFVAATIFTVVFLGGWGLPFYTPPAQIDLGLFVLPYFDMFFGIGVFAVKAYAVVALLMWIRWTYPRLRPDQLMNLGWKILLPLAFVNLIICTIISAFNLGG